MAQRRAEGKDSYTPHPRQERKAECHPDRKHRASGLCASCYAMAWQKAHPEADTGNNWLKARPAIQKTLNRKYHLMHKHGTRIEQYVEAWHRQEGKCANPRCGAAYPLELDDHRKGLHVDHNHATGFFRGLLCPGCNVALGMIGEDVERLLGLVEYLTSFTPEEEPTTA